MNKIINKAGKFIVSIGPAFFVVGYTIGTGSIVTMASAGSRYGMEMLWVLVLACLFSFVMLDVYGRYTIVTGEGTLYGIKKHIKGGRILSLITLTGLIFVEVLALTGIMGIVSDLLNSWTGILFGGSGWNPVVIVFVISIIVYLVILMGKYSLFEKILIVFVSIMGLSFFMTFFVIPPDPVELVKGLIPSIPQKANAPIILAAIVGTTFTAPTFVVRSILMKEKKWDMVQMKHARKDAIIGSTMMFLISMSVMASAAATLYVAGNPVDKVVTMVTLLEPLLGRFAISVFVSGILGAALSSIFPIVMLAPLLLSDYQNKPVKYKGRSFRILTGVAILFGLIVPVFEFKPVFVMLVSQAFQVFLLPIVVLAIMYLINRKDLMKEFTPGKFMNLSLWIIFLFTLLISYQAVVGLFESFGTIF
ncbi:MAG: divalent metal cation transporter [Chlorobi bacterium]|nr:divalent metal cation transporter [Chlorobiota bacterium]